MNTEHRASSNNCPSKGGPSKLRVTLHGSIEAQGQPEVFTFEIDTLSSVEAKAEARRVANRNKLKWFKVVSMTPILSIPNR